MIVESMDVLILNSVVVIMVSLLKDLLPMNVVKSLNLVVVPMMPKLQRPVMMITVVLLVDMDVALMVLSNNQMIPVEKVLKVVNNLPLDVAQMVLLKNLKMMIVTICQFVEINLVHTDVVMMM